MTVELTAEQWFRWLFAATAVGWGTHWAYSRVKTWRKAYVEQQGELDAQEE